jgi:hypothetical protein
MPCQVSGLALVCAVESGSDKLDKYAYVYRESRNGCGRGGHSIEPNPYSMKVK